MSWLEILGFVTALVLTLKTVYNLSHFVYTTFLGRLLGHGLAISKCGPWAGIIQISFKEHACVVDFKMIELFEIIRCFFFNSGNGGNRRNREILRSFGVYYFIFLNLILYLYRLILNFFYTIFIFPAKLAAEGLNVVLISRTPAKLDKVANEIS